MSSMSINGTLQAEYVYNAQGQQVIRRLIPSGQIIHSLFDLDGNRIAEYDYNSATGTSTLLREYVWMNGSPVAVIEGGQIYHIGVDHIGRPVFAVDASGTKVWSAEYLPFGGVHTTTNTPIALRFPGQWFQSESGLHQNWMRDYDPTTGRYIQADPLGLVDGASVYGYVGQNPGRYVDPRGEQEFPFEGLGDLQSTRGFQYHPRVFAQSDLFHQFPFVYDSEIWALGASCGGSLNPSGPDLAWGYYNCRCLPGTLNGRNGVYEIGVRVPFIFESPFGWGALQPTVVHRVFIPY